MLACGSVACGRAGVWTWMCCVRMWMQMSRKERRRKKKKTYFSAGDWLADVLRADALACGRGCVACGCR